jgi:hypothetical protein
MTFFVIFASNPLIHAEQNRPDSRKTEHMPEPLKLMSVSLFKRLFASAALFLAAAALSARLPAAAQTQPETRDGKWAQDVRIFAEGFPNDQKDFAKVYGKEKFDAEVTALQKDIPQLSDAEIVLRLMRIVAIANIGHNSVSRSAGAFRFRRLPLTLRWYSDGLGVIAASQEYSDAIGARVIKIGSMTPEQLETAVTPYISHETEIWLHQLSPEYITNLDLLQYLKLTDVDGRVEFTFAKNGGDPFTLGITRSEGVRADDPLIDGRSALHIPVPLASSHPGSYYWYQVITDAKTLYIQYNRCENDPKQSFADFTQEMFSAVEARPINRVVIDLRFNLGGNSKIVGPLVGKLKRWPKLSGPGSIYTLIGRSTFSSGLMAASEFRTHDHAILLGEPSGEMPDSYGEVREITLPNSHWIVRYTTKYFRTPGASNATTFAPDIPVPMSFEDFLADRDPVLDAALQHPLK